MKKIVLGAVLALGFAGAAFAEEADCCEQKDGKMSACCEKAAKGEKMACCEKHEKKAEDEKSHGAHQH